MYRLPLALAAGALYSLAFAPFSLWPLVPLSIAILYWLLQGTSPARSALLGWVWGLGAFGVGVSWLYVSIHVYGFTPAPLAVLLTALFCMGLALFPALMTWLSARLGHHVVAFAGLWLLVDWMRGWFLTGFPWLYPGYAFIDTPLARLSPVGGVWLVSLIVLLTALAPTMLIRRQPRGAAALAGIAAVGWLASLFISPALWVKPAGEPVKVALVQGNVPQDIKWMLTQQEATREIYRALTEQIEEPGLVVWPESAITEFWQDARFFLTAQAERVEARGGKLLSGLPWREYDSDGPRYYNSLVVIGDEPDVYRKQKLVPFGEYVPLQELLRGTIPFFDLPMSSFSRGSPRQDNLNALGLNIAPLICYEVMYPQFVAERAAESDVLLTVSNDAWFGTSFGPLQHFQQARMRTLETGRWLLRGTNNGVTAIVDHNGRVRARLPQFERAVLEGEFQPMTGVTPYVRTGSWPVLLLAALMVAGPLLRRIRKSKGDEA